MLEREMGDTLRRAAAGSPVVALVGPRGAGKTTLAAGTFPSLPLVSLEDPALRDAAGADPRSFLARFPGGAVVDEVVLAPALLPLLGQAASTGLSGPFILTASAEPAGHATLADSLGDRARILTLWPFSRAELRGFDRPLGDLDLVVLGSFPHVHNVLQDPDEFYEHYLDAFLMGEGLSHVGPAEGGTFRRFLEATARRVGLRASLSAQAREADCPSRLGRRWLDLLRWSHLVAELPAGASKRLWFTDTGLAAFLLGIRTREQASTHELRDRLLQNLAVTEGAKARLNLGQTPVASI